MKQLVSAPSMVLVLAMAATGCGDSGSGDAGPTGGDAATAGDSGATGTDGGSTAGDSGATGTDSGSTAGDSGSAGEDGGATGTDGGSANDDGGATDSDSGTSADGGTSSDAGGSATDAASACSAFCDQAETVCTGSLDQFASLDECLTECAGLPAGTAGATSGNSLACRQYHLSVAAMPGNAAVHCPHVGGAAPCSNGS